MDECNGLPATARKGHKANRLRGRTIHGPECGKAEGRGVGQRSELILAASLIGALKCAEVDRPSKLQEGWAVGGKAGLSAQESIEEFI